MSDDLVRCTKGSACWCSIWYARVRMVNRLYSFSCLSSCICTKRLCPMTMHKWLHLFGFAVNCCEYVPWNGSEEGYETEQLTEKKNEIYWKAWYIWRAYTYWMVRELHILQCECLLTLNTLCTSGTHKYSIVHSVHMAICVYYIYTRHSLAHSHARNQFLCGITTTVADTVCACVLKVQTIWHGKATDVAAGYYLFIYLFVVCVVYASVSAVYSVASSESKVNQTTRINS